MMAGRFDVHELAVSGWSGFERAAQKANTLPNYRVKCLLELHRHCSVIGYVAAFLIGESP